MQVIALQESVGERVADADLITSHEKVSDQGRPVTVFVLARGWDPRQSRTRWANEQGAARPLGNGRQKGAADAAPLDGTPEEGLEPPTR
jgi:hypothetical protein